MPVINPDGSKLYTSADPVTDVVFNGESILDYGPIEVLVSPGGWGRVMTSRAIYADDFNQAGQGKTLVDGQTRTFFYWGTVVVTEPE